jgi:hypothetical protein
MLNEPLACLVGPGLMTGDPGEGQVFYRMEIGRGGCGPTKAAPARRGDPRLWRAGLVRTGLDM